MSYSNYKENFENGENGEYRKNKPEHHITEKEEFTYNLYILLIGYTIIICFGVYFHLFFYSIINSKIFRLSIIIVIFFPLVIFSYYIFFHLYSVREDIRRSYESLLSEAGTELERESKLSTEVIPLILFGVGVIYGSIEKFGKKHDLLKIVAPYFIFSLLFGTVIPYIIYYLIIDHYNLNRLSIASDLNFISISISFGLMTTSLLIPFLILY